MVTFCCTVWLPALLLLLLLLGEAAAQSPPSLRGSADNATLALAATERASAPAENSTDMVDGFVASWGMEVESSPVAQLAEGDVESFNVRLDSRSSSKARKLLTLYHQTSPDIAKLILNSAFRVGTQGWCGGGIYFANSPADTETKAIGPDSHKGFIIEALVDVGHVLDMNSTCDRQMSGPKLWARHYDSIRFDPGDGMEFVVYESDRVLSMKAYSS